MCGICGKYNFDSETRVEQNLILKMLNSLNQRGPDQARAYLQANLGFGAAILNIRDPENATQPFFNENKQIFSVFNGEIYNYPQLRKFLEEKGHQLKTNCDAEIISHLYEEYGPEFVNQLNGMFSIALFDQSNNALLLARDRIGIKPLYYSLANGRITFASAVTALIIDLDISRELDSLGIDCYFSLNYFPGE
ncbi:MAG: asparagine synthetase B, partial [Candidatus Omnitrophica bacterium]|nr:asparagine synthetase B [Candidatus Omnitrophota bacterium]